MPLQSRTWNLHNKCVCVYTLMHAAQITLCLSPPPPPGYHPTLEHSINLSGCISLVCHSSDHSQPHRPSWACRSPPRPLYLLFCFICFEECSRLFQRPQPFTETLPQSPPCHRSLSLTAASSVFFFFVCFSSRKSLTRTRAILLPVDSQHQRTVQVPSDHAWQARDSSEMPTLALGTTKSFRKTTRFLISTSGDVPVTRII